MNGLVVRPIQPDDTDRLLRFFDRLSPETVYRRFFTLFPSPPAWVLQHLLTIDHHDHDGLVALDGDEIVAVARWDRYAAEGAPPEVSIVVEDAWQHRGVGRALMRSLTAEIAREGFTGLTATVLTENRPPLCLARGLAPPSAVAVDGAVTSLSFRLAG